MSDILRKLCKDFRALLRSNILVTLCDFMPLIWTSIYFILTAANFRWYLNQIYLGRGTDIFVYYWIRQTVINFPIRSAVEVLPLLAWLPGIASSGPGKDLCLLAGIIWEVALVDFVLGGLWWFAITSLGAHLVRRRWRMKLQQEQR